MNWIDQIAGLFSAVAGALGLGGGGVLVLYLTLGIFHYRITFLT